MQLPQIQPHARTRTPLTAFPVMQMIEGYHEDENQDHHHEKKGDSNGHAVTPVEILQGKKWSRSSHINVSRTIIPYRENYRTTACMI